MRRLHRPVESFKPVKPVGGEWTVQPNGFCMIDWPIRLSGLTLVVIGGFETLMAVLHPRSTVGPVTAAIERGYRWALRRPRSIDTRLVHWIGPSLLLVQVVVWSLLLLFGSALLVWPSLGETIVSSEPAADRGFVTALYYAGFTLTTLGVGDLFPTSSMMKLLTVIGAAVGFSFFTLVLTYAMSIYSALVLRNQFAREIDYRTGRTGRTTEYLWPYLRTDHRPELNDDLSQLTSRLAGMVESQHLYPALLYFRFRDARYSMTRMVGFCLEVSTLLRALHRVSTEQADHVREPADRMWHASRQMLEEIHEHFNTGEYDSCQDHECVDPGRCEMVQELLRRWANESSVPSSWQLDRLADQYESDRRLWFDDLQRLRVGFGSRD